MDGSSGHNVSQCSGRLLGVFLSDPIPLEGMLDQRTKNNEKGDTPFLCASEARKQLGPQTLVPFCLRMPLFSFKHLITAGDDLPGMCCCAVPDLEQMNDLSGV